MLKYLLMLNIFLIEGHSVDMPVSNPFLTDKLIDEELKQMMDMQVSEKRRGCVLISDLSLALSFYNSTFWDKQLLA